MSARPTRNHRTYEEEWARADTLHSVKIFLKILRAIEPTTGKYLKTTDPKFVLRNLYAHLQLLNIKPEEAGVTDEEWDRIRTFAPKPYCRIGFK